MWQQEKLIRKKESRFFILSHTISTIDSQWALNISELTMMENLGSSIHIPTYVPSSSFDAPSSLVDFGYLP